MDKDQWELLNQALINSSCTSLLEKADLHPIKETVNLDIMSLWGDGSIFALDSIIKKGATQTQAHPQSVTANLIPGRFVDQGTWYLVEDSSPLEATIIPSQKDLLVLTPFDVENLEQKTLSILMENPNLLEFKTLETAAALPEFYSRITLDDYRSVVDFSQSCLDQEP